MDIAARVHALKGDKAKSMDFLRRAVDAGYGDAAACRAAEEFELVHGDPRFINLLQRMDEQPEQQVVTGCETSEGDI